LQQTYGSLGARLDLVYVANSRAAWSGALDLQQPLTQVLARPPTGQVTRESIEAALGAAHCRIVVDVTDSEQVADWHPHWLARGIHVVTACKRGQGGALARWQAIQAACRDAGTCYGDSATVGAGLPVLRTLRALRAGGDRIHAIAGVLSGSLAWLLNAYDGRRPFSGFVREARKAGYMEPDPRVDLSGEDVRRKLLILARAAGDPLQMHAVQVTSLLPPQLLQVPIDALDAALPQLDAPLRRRYAEAWKQGGRLRFIARWQAGGGARVGLEVLAPDDPLAMGSGTDNRIAIWSDRYASQPVVLQGPGAGADVTAAAVLDDVLAIQACALQSCRPKNSAIGCGFWNTYPCA
jgi:homoserine dehydrogenase